MLVTKSAILWLRQIWDVGDKINILLGLWDWSPKSTIVHQDLKVISDHQYILSPASDTSIYVVWSSFQIRTSLWKMKQRQPWETMKKIVISQSYSFQHLSLLFSWFGFITISLQFYEGEFLQNCIISDWIIGSDEASSLRILAQDDNLGKSYIPRFDHASYDC